MSTTQSPRSKRAQTGAHLGPISDLESHLPEDWWSTLFDKLYLLTDGDVFENAENTRTDIDAIIAAAGLRPGDTVTDLCCGQGRHLIELANRGFDNLTGIDRSRYLIRVARKRAQDAGVAGKVALREGDARSPRLADASQDAVLILGNAFGYFSSEAEDQRVLESCARVLRSGGTLVLDITDGDWLRDNFEARSWEWIDKHHFVCRERALSSDGDRLISREVICHDEKGVIVDQFYAERLYSFERLSKLLRDAGFRDVARHETVEAKSARNQDLGMMAHRMLLTAEAPRRERPVKRGQKTVDVTVVMGDPRLPDTVKRDGKFNQEDFDTIDELKDALSDIEGYRFSYLNNHTSLERDLETCESQLILNLCDEGYRNDAFKELHVPALLELYDLPYTGAGPGCLAMCYYKALVRAVAQSIDIPVPLETFVRAGDQSATLPAVFPAMLKPNFGDSSVGITADAVVHDKMALFDYLEKLQAEFADMPLLVQEYLTGNEYTVGVIGNPKHGFRSLPVLEVDYSNLDPKLPKILGYESKWLPDSPYWTQIQYKPAELDEAREQEIVGYAYKLFERLGCRDYGRFDFRAAADGTIKLLEANPNPGWCWDGKFNLMAGFEGQNYSQLLGRILGAACERYGIQR